MEWSCESCIKCITWTFLILIIINNYKQYKKLAKAKTTSFRFLLKPMIYLLLVPITYPSILFMALFRQALKLILSLKHGNRYLGFLNGPDIIFAMDKEAVYHLVCIIEFKNDSSEPIYEFVKNNVRKQLLARFREDPKSSGVVHKAFGYFYLLKEETDFDDCFKKLKMANSRSGEISINDLAGLLSEYSDAPLSKDNKALWEILIGTQPIKMETKPQDRSKKYYPVVLKAHHSLGDARHVFKTMIEFFSDDITSNQVKEPSTNDNNGIVSEIIKYLTTALIEVACFIRQVYYILLIPSVAYVNAILMKTEQNLLHGPPLTNQKILCITAEKSPHYIQVVKRIKQKFRGCSFEDVFVAAFTASISEYFRQNATHIPEYLLAEIPAVPEAVELRLLHPQQLKGENIRCSNELSGYVRKLPIGMAYKGTKENLIETLQFITSEAILLKKTAEKEVYYWLINGLITLVPYPFIELLRKETQNTAIGISNVPGPPYFSVFGGCQVKDILPFAAHRKYAGIAANIFTYDNRLKLSLIVDKALIANEKEVQAILDRVYKYIDMLDSDT